MGSWAETCGISQLPIESGDKIRAFILLDNTYSGKLEGGGTCYSNGEWSPFGISIQGEYNDYGGMENIIENDYTELMIDTLKKGWVVSEEDAKHWSIPMDLKKLKLSDVLNAIERSCAQYNSFTRKNTSLGIMYVLEDVYQSIMNFNPIRAHFHNPGYDYKPVHDAYNEDIRAWYTENLNTYLKYPSDKTLFHISLSSSNISNIFENKDNIAASLLKYKFMNLIEEKIPFEDTSVQALCEPLWEMIHFNRMMIDARKLWHPQAGKGSQENNLEIYKKLQNTISNIISKREKEFEEENIIEKPDENGYYPYMLKHNAKLKENKL